LREASRCDKTVIEPLVADILEWEASVRQLLDAGEFSAG
jgi:hypothetical protein